MQRHIAASKAIDAPPAVLYGIIADYHDGHRRIVPPRVFKWLAVDKGGIGAGTEIRLGMRVLGLVHALARRRHRAASRPPARRDAIRRTAMSRRSSSSPVRRNIGSTVTIQTDLELPGGIAGRLQGFFLGRLLRPLYVEELQRLADRGPGGARHRFLEHPTADTISNSVHLHPMPAYVVAHVRRHRSGPLRATTRRSFSTR